MRGLFGPSCGVAFALACIALTAGAGAQEAQPVPALEPVSTSDVFGRGVDGYPEVRIPSVVVTPSGVVLAFAEGRQGGDHSENDIVLKRSLDKGVTWQPLQVIAEMGGDSLNDPCAVVIPESGRVLLIYERYPKGFHAGGGPNIRLPEHGYGGVGNTQTFLTRSDDDGATWSAPEDITRSVRRPDALSVGSPGIGIQLEHGPHKGRLLFPLYEYAPPTTDGGGYYNCAAISDDGGATWRVGARISEAKVKGDADECQLVELGDGTVVMDARQGRGSLRRGATSHDSGGTWEPMYDVPDLVVTPCMGSILRIDTEDGSDVLALSVPFTPDKRMNGTLLISRDGGKTWPERQVLYAGEFAYSCLARMGKGRVGCLFERDDYAHITFAVFDVSTITGPGDSKQPG